MILGIIVSIFCTSVEKSRKRHPTEKKKIRKGIIKKKDTIATLGLVWCLPSYLSPFF